MKLRSGKVVVKMHKNSSGKSDDEEEEDIISKLPDALLIQILSLLPEADANQTRILSKRWKDLWAFLPNLHIVMPFCQSIEEINKFYNAVNQTFALRGGTGMHIQRFSLYCSTTLGFMHVRDWLYTVVQSKVQELELRVPSYGYKVGFCWDLFKTCNTLVKLTLRGEFSLDLPEPGLLLPCVKKMDLVSIVYMGDQSFVDLVSGCPSLEELYVKIDIFRHYDISHLINFSSPSLKRLSILVGGCNNMNDSNIVVIDAPNLEYLCIKDHMHTKFMMKRFFNGEADITADTEDIHQLVARLSSARKLTFTYSTMTALHSVQLLNMPMFPNLVKLVVGIRSIHHSNLLMRALLDMPNVEHISFFNLSIRYVKYMRWNLPLEAPACLRFKVKNIIINNQEAVTPEDFIFIRYLLEHSTKLETLTINADPEMREQLLSIHCGSNTRRFEFI